MLWFTADTHFDHANIIEYARRPFQSLDEMNETMVANWNAVVQPGDTVYHLGDFAFRRHYYFARRLNGQIVLIEGSHDRMSASDRKAFTWVGPMHVVHGETDIVLCHYAMRVWPRSHYGTWHLFGHSHGYLPPQGKSFDVGVDCWSFTPISLTAVGIKMAALEVVGVVDDRYRSEKP